jgi:hypothetical protein
VEALGERSFLSRLALVNINITDDTFLSLCDYVESSEKLEELNISWAAVRPETMYRLL